MEWTKFNFKTDFGRTLTAVQAPTLVFQFIFGKTAKSVLFSTCLFFIILTCGTYGTWAEATHQRPPDPTETMVLVEIPSWKNRSSYPRFLLYRDALRHRHDKSDNGALSSYSAITSSQTKSQEATSTVSSASDEKSTLATFTEYDYNDEDLLLGQITASRTNQGEAINNANISVKQDNKDNAEKPITFPKDRTNPYNRLQIDLEEVAKITRNVNQSGSSQSFPPLQTSHESVNSLELGNRENFSNSPSQLIKDDEDKDLLILKDAVPTVDLTMKIIKLSKWNEENVVFSPLSIANVLSMLLLGADGVTFEELATLLDKNHHLSSSSGWNITKYHEAFQKLNHYFKISSGRGVDFTTASEVFVDKHFPINSKFKKQLRSFYDARVESFNFGKDGEIFKEKINKWVREKTHNQIRSILEEPPSTSTVLGIVNAIYFKGPWEVPFNERVSSLKEFRVRPKEKLKVQMMVNELMVPYIERDAYKMTSLPYRDNQTALYLILPKGNDGINDLKSVEKILTPEDLSESINQMDEKKVTVFLPRLKFTSDGHMKEILENMGLSSLFKNGRSNLTRISNSSELYVSSIVHRAVVEINEKGTEASAVTAGTVDRIFEEPPIPFNCNKPFIFFIYHINADTIVFWGRVTRPENFPAT